MQMQERTNKKDMESPSYYLNRMKTNCKTANVYRQNSRIYGSWLLEHTYIHTLK